MFILGHIQAWPTRFLTQRTSLILKKRWPNNDSFLRRRASAFSLQFYNNMNKNMMLLWNMDTQNYEQRIAYNMKYQYGAYTNTCSHTHSEFEYSLLLTLLLYTTRIGIIDFLCNILIITYIFISLLYIYIYVIYIYNNNIIYIYIFIYMI